MMKLHRWQIEALAKWEQAGCRGIIEAFPGAGKTIVGIEAIRRLFARHGRFLTPLVVVPSIVIMDEWCERFRECFPEASVGLYFGGRKDDYSTGLASCRVIIAVVNSITRDHNLKELLAHTKRSDKYCTLLVADECHHYVDGTQFSTIGRYAFDCTMGLSATAGHWAIDGIGSVVYDYTFKKAMHDGSVPRFHLVNIGVAFSASELANYLELDDQIGTLFKKVKQLFEYELRYIPSHLFLRRLQQISRNCGPTGDPLIARLFGLMFKRAELCYTATHKQQLAHLLVQLLLHAHRKTIVFFERIRSATSMADDVSLHCAADLSCGIKSGGGAWCEVFHSGMDDADRDRVLGEFRENDASVLVACRSLDEGVNIPTVDAAILAASTQSLRQRIQRIGRVLRQKANKADPIIITLYVRGSGDENVVAEDRDAFEGVATIHDVSAGDALSTVAGILGMSLHDIFPAAEPHGAAAPAAGGGNCGGEAEGVQMPVKGNPVTARRLSEHLGLEYPQIVAEIERHGQFQIRPDTAVYGTIVEQICRKKGRELPPVGECD